jgi:hypothetical protein
VRRVGGLSSRRLRRELTPSNSSCCFAVTYTQEIPHFYCKYQAYQHRRSTLMTLKRAVFGSRKTGIAMQLSPDALCRRNIIRMLRVSSYASKTLNVLHRQATYSMRVIIHCLFLVATAKRPEFPPSSPSFLHISVKQQHAGCTLRCDV